MLEDRFAHSASWRFEHRFVEGSSHQSAHGSLPETDFI